MKKIKWGIVLKKILTRKNRTKKIIRILGLTAFLGIFFQNCFSSQLIEESSYSSVSENQIPIIHPPEEKPLPPTQQLQVVNRVYIEGLFRDIFKDENGVELTNLDNILHLWIVNRGVQLGYSCDVYGSYSGRDCVASLSYGSVYSNASGPVRRNDNVLRQSYVIKLCESVLENDAAVNIILKKIERDVTQKANYQSISMLWDLFYRGDLISDNHYSALAELDLSLFQAGENNIDRWRAVILTVCESPGWQAL